jgi:hypothetical protein
MDIHTLYIVNKADVVSEHFDDEMVIINLDNGNYYSISGMGVDIWNLLEKSATFDDIVVAFTNIYTVPNTSELLSVVKQFIVELLEEGLIIPDITNSKRSTETVQNIEKEIPLHEKSTLNPEKIILNKYTDMQDFLLVDPIHELEYSDWPQS